MTIYLVIMSEVFGSANFRFYQIIVCYYNCLRKCLEVSSGSSRDRVGMSVLAVWGSGIWGPCHGCSMEGLRINLSIVFDDTKYEMGETLGG
jgi:hypothetical protein